MKLDFSFATPHLLHVRRFTQLLQTRLSALVCSTPLPKDAPDFQSRQIVHSNGVPSFFLAFTQSKQNLRSGKMLAQSPTTLPLPTHTIPRWVGGSGGIP